jgi:hypothetical protein
MASRLGFFSVFLLLIFSSALCYPQIQTATCTNWKFFNLSVDTHPHGINQYGTVVGDIQSPTGSGNGLNSLPQTSLGFVRYSNGAFKTYMTPNSQFVLTTKASQTHFTRRNALGVTVGWYMDSSDTNPHIHGLVVSGSNTATVDFPANGFSAPPTDTMLLGINYWGSMVGIWACCGGFSSSYAGFELKNGVFTNLQLPGISTVSIHPSSISDRGTIVGWYNQGSTTPFHGFRLANGSLKIIDSPQWGNGTFPNDINSFGVIVGTFNLNSVGASFNTSGFVYNNGVFKPVQVPNFPYSTVDGINNNGYVTGTAYGPLGSTAFTAHCQ